MMFGYRTVAHTFERTASERRTQVPEKVSAQAKKGLLRLWHGMC